MLVDHRCSGHGSYLPKPRPFRRSTEIHFPAQYTRLYYYSQRYQFHVHLLRSRFVLDDRNVIWNQQSSTIFNAPYQQLGDWNLDLWLDHMPILDSSMENISMRSCIDVEQVCLPFVWFHYIGCHNNHDLSKDFHHGNRLDAEGHPIITPYFLAASFLFLVAVPGMVYVFTAVARSPLQLFLHHISFFVDAMIFIFVHLAVGSIKKVKVMKCLFAYFKEKISGRVGIFQEECELPLYEPVCYIQYITAL